MHKCSCRQLVGLGERADRESWGVEPFAERHRDIHTFTRRTGRLPEQREGDNVDYRSLLHRDGSVLSGIQVEVIPGLACQALALAMLAILEVAKSTCH